MHLLTVVFGPSPVPWSFLFKEEQPAHQAFNDMTSAKGTKTPVVITDDFGQQASFDAKDISGFMLEDLEKSKVAAIERALHQERIKIKANQQAKSDPVIGPAMNMNHGPAILSPMGPGRFNG
jgi:hypothetical protein